MPLSICRKLGLGELKPTTILLQLADRSIKYPLGVIEDVFIKEYNFYFLADFIVLDMEEDCNIPLILGRPFLATGRTLINMEKGKLFLWMQGEHMNFKVFKAMLQPSNIEKCEHVLFLGVNFLSAITSSETSASSAVKLYAWSLLRPTPALAPL